MKVSLTAPSYKRPRVKTLDVFPSTRIYVAESELDDYIAANPEGSDIVAVPDRVQGNLCRVRNYILDTEFKQGADAVCIIDDDMTCIYRWTRNGTFGYERRKLTDPELHEMIEVYSELCREWGYRFWGLNPGMTNAKSYRQMTPFNTTKYIGGPFQVHLKNPIRYDERLNLKEDYDMTMQHLRRYRGALRLNMYSYDCKQAEQEGGCAQQRNTDEERRQFELLQRKWGSKIFRADRSSKREFDFNPIMKSPLKGV